MIRVLLTILVPLLLPTAVYLLVTARSRQRARAAGEEPKPFGDGPWVWLALGGVILTAASLIFFFDQSSHKPGSVYTPPRLENGRVVPGHFD